MKVPSEAAGFIASLLCENQLQLFSTNFQCLTSVKDVFDGFNKWRGTKRIFNLHVAFTRLVKMRWKANELEGKNISARTVAFRFILRLAYKPSNLMYRYLRSDKSQNCLRIWQKLWVFLDLELFYVTHLSFSPISKVKSNVAIVRENFWISSHFLFISIRQMSCKLHSNYKLKFHHSLPSIETYCRQFLQKWRSAIAVLRSSWENSQCLYS